MKQSKQTRQAFLMSVLAMLLCVTMLVGTTFAWFTDSVTTGVNKITAGNLDVNLKYSANGRTDWADVTSTTNVFKTDTLWEPGHTEVVYLKVENKGSLALKYKLGITVNGKTIGTSVVQENGTGKEIDLTKYIKYGTAGNRIFSTREQARNAVKDSAVLISEAYRTSNDPILQKGQSSGTLAMVVFMPEEVGNEANYRGAQIPDITLGIELVATQATVESDSFNNEYDKDAEYPTPVASAKELKEALQESGNIALTENITLTSAVAVTQDTVIDLNGKTLSGATNRSALNVAGGDVVIKNGTLQVKRTSGGVQSAVYAYGTADVTIENCTIESNNSWAYPVTTNGSESKDAKIVIKDTEIKNTANGCAAYIPAGDVSLINCNVTGYVCVSGGNVTLDGGTYTSSGFGGQDHVYSKDQAIAFLTTSTGDGAKSFGDAITVLDGRAGYGYGNLTIRNITFNTVLASNGANLYGIRYVDLQGTDAAHYTIAVEGNTYNNGTISAFRMNGEDVTLPE